MLIPKSLFVRPIVGKDMLTVSNLLLAGQTVSPQNTKMSSYPPPSTEFQVYSENCQCETPQVHQHMYSQTLIYRNGDCKWWLRVSVVTPAGRIAHRGSEDGQRREFQEFVAKIDYSQYRLIDNTVTAIIFHEVPDKVNQVFINYKQVASSASRNRFFKIVHYLKYRIQEDPKMVEYLKAGDYSHFPHIHESYIYRKQRLHNGVYLVTDRKTGEDFVLKTIDRENYKPFNTEIIAEEILNLYTFRRVPNIGQAVGLVVNSSPYTTRCCSDRDLYVIGILSKDYSGGALYHVLDEGLVNSYRWKRWPLQIGHALSYFHGKGIAHLDLKPDNIVLDKNDNAFIIDVSGIGGVTDGWIAPELFHIKRFTDLDFHKKVLHDTWAYGKILSWITANAHNCSYRRAVMQVADGLMEVNPKKRMWLCEAIDQLETLAAKGIS